MSRIAKVMDVTVTPNTADDVFLVPAGHKYEVLGVAYNGDGSTAITVLVLRHSSGGYFGRDQLAIPAGVYTVRKDYQMMTFVADDQLCLFMLASGSPGCSAVIDYIDVTL